MMLFYIHQTDVIDFYQDLPTAHEWVNNAVGEPSSERFRWVLFAIAALERSTNVGWAMRSYGEDPRIGTVFAPPDSAPYLVVPDDKGGAQYVLTTTPGVSVVPPLYVKSTEVVNIRC